MTWYRYEDVGYAPSLDEYDNPMGEGRLAINLIKFEVVKKTLKGVQLVRVDKGWNSAEKRFVLDGVRKRYACPSLEEAQVSFLARKRAQARIYSARLKHAREAITKIEQIIELKSEVIK